MGQWTAHGGYVIHSDGARIEMPVGVNDGLNDCHERARRVAAALNEPHGPPCPRCGKPMFKVAVPIERGDDSWVWGHDC